MNLSVFTISLETVYKLIIFGYSKPCFTYFSCKHYYQIFPSSKFFVPLSILWINNRIKNGNCVYIVQRGFENCKNNCHVFRQNCIFYIACSFRWFLLIVLGIQTEYYICRLNDDYFSYDSLKI